MGEWVLLDLLGSGGMGRVYRARHARTGAEAALKLLSESDPDLLLRFQRELEAHARVGSHPNVVRIHAGGSHHGRPYGVIELCPRGDLATRLRQGSFPAGEARRVALGLARGLAHLHAHGVLHRDLKPGNVLFDERDEPRLADFGLARISGSARLTATGEHMGTPAYMAPEQARGQTADERSDVYGAGAVLYHLLTGRPPYQGPSPMAIMVAVAEGPPPAPSEAASGVPPGLEAVCLRAMARDPAARYPTAWALAEALEAPPEAGSPGNRPVWLLPLAVGSLLAVALAVALRGSAAPDPARQPARDLAPPSPAGSTPAAVASPASPAAPAALGPGARARVIDTHARGWVRVAFLGDGRALSLGAAGVTLWDLSQDVPEVRRWETPHDCEAALTAPDGRSVWAAGRGWLMRVTPGDGPLRVFPRFPAVEPVAMACSPDGRWLAVGTDEAHEQAEDPGQVYLFDVSGPDDQEPVRLGPIAGEVNGLAFLPDGRLAAGGGHTRVAKLTGMAPSAVVALNRGQASTLLLPTDGGLTLLRLRPGGRELLVGTGTLRLELLDLATGVPARLVADEVPDSLYVRPSHGGAPVDAVFSADGARIYSISNDPRNRSANELRCWDAERRREALPRRAYPHGRRPGSLALSPDDQVLLLGFHDGQLEVLPLAAWR